MVSSSTHPIGYVEVQRAWVHDGPPGAVMELMLVEMQEEMAGLDKGLAYDGCRLEGTPDGAGVMHYVLYASFVPVQHLSPPLNPRNLNDAPLPAIGGEPVDDASIGMKERRF